MKNVKLYPGNTESSPLEEYDWTGSVYDFFKSQGIDPESDNVPRALLYVNGRLCTDLRGTHLGATDTLEIRPNPKAALPVWAVVAIAVVASAAMSYFLRPKIAGMGDAGQGRQLETAKATANVAKPNQVVPELLGRHIRYPEYLTQPRRFFKDKREQWLDMLLCVGPGRYQIEDVRIGNSPLLSLSGAEYRIYEPSEDLSADEASQNWYSAPEVGGTSTGGAGLELKSDPEDVITPSNPIQYTLLGQTLTIENDFPEEWGQGISIDVLLYENHAVTRDSGVTYFTGDFTAIRGLGVGSLVKTSLTQSVLRINTLDVLPSGQLKISFVIDETSAAFGASSGSVRAGFSHNGDFSVVSLSGNQRTLTLEANGTVLWTGFPESQFSASDVKMTPIISDIGDWSGPFYAAPRSERPTVVEVDLYFPGGLTRLNGDGNREDYSVVVEIQYKSDDEAEWTLDIVNYTEKTLDQIGFTRRYVVSGSSPVQFRVRRRSLKSTSAQVQDVVQWYGLRSLLRTPTRYEGWTTMTLRLQGLGEIAQSSENKVSVYATRMLPTLDSEELTPTRDISAAVLHILRTSGYSLSDIDMQQLRDLHNLWTARGEYADGIFDDGTVSASLEQVLIAGMAEYTIENGLFRPVREGIRTLPDHEQVFSAENTTSFSRSFTALKPDANDGVEIEYQDADDNFATHKIVCKLPDSMGLKLERIKLSFVTNKTTAWRIGMRRARELRYRRWSYQWDTELDARNCSYKGYQLLVPEVPSMGRSYVVSAVAHGVIYLDQPVEWSANNVFALRTIDGKLNGPYPAVRHGDKSISSSVYCAPGDVLFFGTSQKVVHHVITTKITIGANRTQAQGVNYDERVYADDNNQPEA